MKHYTFFKITDSRAINTIEVELYDSDDDAKAHAHAILAEGQHVAIEVYNGSEFFVVGEPNRNNEMRAS